MEHQAWDRSRLLCQLFVSVGETFVQWLAAGQCPAFCSQLLDCILLTLQHPDVELAGYSFGFWSLLAAELSNREQQQQALQASPPPPRPAAAFVPHYTQLVVSVQRMLVYPADYTSWHEEQKDDHRKYRYAAADTLVDAVAVLGVDAALQLLWAATQSQLLDYQQTAGQRWHGLEASLHCFRAVGGRVSVTESAVIPQLMRFLEQHRLVSASCPQPLAYTSILLIGRYADWVNEHLAYLPPLLSTIVAALNWQPLQAPAALAFRHLCDAASRHLVEEQAVQAMSAQQPVASSSPSYLPALLSVYTASSALQLAEQKDVIQGVCLVLCALPADRLHRVLQSVLQPITQQLEACMAALQQQAAGARAAVSAAVSLSLERLSCVFSDLDPLRNDHPDAVRAAIAQLVLECWPLLSSVLEAWADDDSKMEKLCKCWRYAFKKTASSDRQPQQQQPLLAPLLPQLLHAVTQLYCRHQQPSAQPLTQPACPPPLPPLTATSAVCCALGLQPLPLPAQHGCGPVRPAALTAGQTESGQRRRTQAVSAYTDDAVLRCSALCLAAAAVQCVRQRGACQPQPAVCRLCSRVSSRRGGRPVRAEQPRVRPAEPPAAARVADGAAVVAAVVLRPVPAAAAPGGLLVRVLLPVRPAG